MHHGIAYLLTAGLALAAGPYSAASPSSIPHLTGDVDILIDGSPLPRYAHDGRWYVEARKGDYAIRLRNPFGVRVAVALAVDGLNTIDARDTTAADARKWVLGPYETVVISGWQTSQTLARRFEFTTEARSYGQALAKTDNQGVISAVFFKERPPTLAPPATTHDFTARRSEAPQAPAPSAPDAAAAPGTAGKTNEFAATGMGRPTDHVISQVWLPLEGSPAQVVDIRYEFRPQLVRLGILPAAHSVDPLQRREGAHGFAPGFCPAPPRRR